MKKAKRKKINEKCDPEMDKARKVMGEIYLSVAGITKAELRTANLVSLKVFGCEHPLWSLVK